MAQAGGCGLEYFYLWEAAEIKTTGPGPVSLSQVGDGGSRRAVLSALPSLNCLVNLLDRNRDGEPGWLPPPSEPGWGEACPQGGGGRLTWGWGRSSVLSRGHTMGGGVHTRSGGVWGDCA